jgi:hypothetical protein
LTLKVLLGRRFALEQLLIDVGDRDYLAGRLAELYSEQEATAPTWRDLFGDQVPALLPTRAEHTALGPATARAPSKTSPPMPVEPSGGAASWDVTEIKLTRQRLARLMYVKQYEDQYRQARGELKRRTTILIATVLLVVMAGFAISVVFLVGDPRAPLAAIAAGASGAALGGLIKLRDEVTLGSQMRQFWPFFIGQVLIGAAAGLFAFLVVEAGIVKFGGPHGVGSAALAFAVGFSEAAFVGLLGRLVGMVGQADKASKRGLLVD